MSENRTEWISLVIDLVHNGLTLKVHHPLDQQTDKQLALMSKVSVLESLKEVPAMVVDSIVQLISPNWLSFCDYWLRLTHMHVTTYIMRMQICST